MFLFWFKFNTTREFFGYRRSYLFHGAIEDCVADEIIMRNNIHKDMNIDYAAYMDSNLAWSKMLQEW